MRSPDLARPLWGVRTSDNGPLSLPGLCRAYLARAHESAFFSHATAARLWGIRLPSGAREQPGLDVAVPFPKRAPAADRIRAHKLTLKPGDVVQLDGLPVTSPQRTILDLARMLRPEDLLAAIDSALWHQRPLVDRDGLLLRLEGFSGRGAKALAAVLPEMTDRSDSSPESVMRWRIIRFGLPHPEINVPVIEHGVFLAQPDLTYRRFRMAFDYEGDHHRTDPVQWQKDLARVPRLQDAGWHHTRISAQDLRDSREFLARLSRQLRARGWSPSN
ncbi:MAG: hypothetical protein JWN36_659 [Microbacteriaceae bacterium]|nr:hypothetical protein [Microbacteriaceae bacterium]